MSMNWTPRFFARLAELAGADVAKQMQHEFGGFLISIPRSSKGAIHAASETPAVVLYEARLHRTGRLRDYLKLLQAAKRAHAQHLREPGVLRLTLGPVPEAGIAPAAKQPQARQPGAQAPENCAASADAAQTGSRHISADYPAPAHGLSTHYLGSPCNSPSDSTSFGE